MSTKTALVIRATGSQSNGVINHLAKSGWNIRAFVNDPTAERAQALQKYSNNVTLHKGTLDNASSVEAAIKGCNAVFLTQFPSFTDDSETRDARNLLQLAKAAGVKHIVHTTQLALADPNFITNEKWTNSILRPAVIGKYEVEQLVRDSGIPYTILRPGWFMTNITLPMVNYYFPEIAQGKITSSYQRDGILATVDTDDIGAFVAAAFNHPEKFTGQTISVVSENLTTAQLIEQISEVKGTKYNVHYRTAEETAALGNDPITLGQTLTHGLERFANMDEIKSWGVPLTTFREFLEKNKSKLA
ncbi:NAD(P)-binding protein [Byssothecium circinans]|uniref:NAD(P)-binding protein n=1 Tax=Byssothecium circinans TaxID=147558 RepID=A0A6A5U4I1_9PLEO|nr:NAD(P)-binding protein [Byssothecium circinans]